MGMSPDAKVFWGPDLGIMYDTKTGDSLMPSWYDDEAEDDACDQWKRVAAERLGWVETGDWDADRNAQRALLDGLGVELQQHGPDGGDPCWRVSVTRSEQFFSGWGTRTLKPLVEDSIWATQVARFMTLLDLPVPGKPGWLITVDYG